MSLTVSLSTSTVSSIRFTQSGLSAAPSRSSTISVNPAVDTISRINTGEEKVSVLWGILVQQKHLPPAQASWRGIAPSSSLTSKLAPLSSNSYRRGKHITFSQDQYFDSFFPLSFFLFLYLFFFLSFLSLFSLFSFSFLLLNQYPESKHPAYGNKATNLDTRLVAIEAWQMKHSISIFNHIVETSISKIIWISCPKKESHKCKCVKWLDRRQEMIFDKGACQNHLYFFHGPHIGQNVPLLSQAPVWPTM